MNSLHGGVVAVAQKIALSFLLDASEVSAYFKSPFFDRI
jgi:hypothetical protein